MNSLFLVPGTFGLGFKFVGTQEESFLNSWKKFVVEFAQSLRWRVTFYNDISEITSSVICLEPVPTVFCKLQRCWMMLNTLPKTKEWNLKMLVSKWNILFQVAFFRFELSVLFDLYMKPMNWQVDNVSMAVPGLHKNNAARSCISWGGGISKVPFDFHDSMNLGKATQATNKRDL